MNAARHLLRLLLSTALLFAACQAQARLAPVPPLVGHVTDQAAMLAPEQRAKLDGMLAEYEQRTGSQIAVLLVKTTEPEAIEQYGIRVADAWKLGRKGIDDGVLILVAKDNPTALRRLRIEAGRGVQGVLTDAKSKRVLQDVIAPHFRQQHYYEGLVAGVGAITTLLDTEKFAAPAAQAQHQAQDSFSNIPIVPLLIFAAILFAIFRPRGRSRALANESWGSGATGFIIGTALSQLGRHGGGGGGFSGGGSSGGGFSGGGGGFDGGGASGDW